MARAAASGSREARELLAAARASLEASGCESPALDASLLLAHAAGMSRTALLAASREAMPGDVAERFEALVARRAAGIPVAYLTSRKEFYGRDFFVDERVLVPRPDTETLVEAALGLMDAMGAGDGRIAVHDAFTGSGCVGVSIAAERPRARVSLSDLSPGALEVAAENAERLLGRALPEFSVDLLPAASDLPVRGEACASALPPYGLITANPPYVTSALSDELLARGWGEPRSALDGGLEGLDLYARFVPAAFASLAPGGALALEIGEEQAQAVVAICERAGFERVRATRDLSGRDRVVVASRPGLRPRAGEGAA